MELPLGLLGAFCLAALANWRLGIFLAIVMAFLQDMMRKLTPDQPPVFIVFTGVVFGAAMCGAAMRGVRLTPSAIQGWGRTLKLPFALYVVLVCLQALNSFLRFGNLTVTGLGLVNYLAPFVAMTAAYQFALSRPPGAVHRFYVLYAALASAGIVSVALQAAGVEYKIFGEVGVGLLIYDRVLGTIIRPYSGIFRASEIAAWHSAMCASVIVLLASYRRWITSQAVLGLMIAIILLYLGALTGRRKMVPAAAIFLCVYFAMASLAMGQTIWRTAVLCLLAGAVYFVAAAFPGEDVLGVRSGDGYSVYLAHSKTAFGDIPGRFVELGLSPVMWAYNSFGILGQGVGLGTQGAALITEVGDTGAAEGGLGKIMMELGAPGLLLLPWLGIAFARHIWWAIRSAARLSPAIGRLASGLLAILCANFASFTIATQAFGDTFILLFLGVTLGSLLATPRIAEQEAASAAAPHPDMARPRVVAAA